MKVTENTISLFTDASILIKGKMRSALPLSLSQCQTLWFVEERGRPNMHDIAGHFKIKAPSVTPLVEELVRGGLIARKASITDRRKIELVLTSKGKKMCENLKKRRTEVLNDVFKVLRPKDFVDLHRILKKISTAA